MRAKHCWLILASITLICALACLSCDDETIAGCDGYNHIYSERIGIGLEQDSIYFFLAAMDGVESDAPISYELFSSENLTDTLIITLHVYGHSYDSQPSPSKEVLWYSDTLVVWYSGFEYRDDCFLYPYSGIQRTPPCPEPYYRVDYISILYPEDKHLVLHDDVLVCH